VHSDLVGAFVKIDGSANDGDDDSGAITINGSLRGDTSPNSGSIFAAGDLGAVKIVGRVIGSSGSHSGSIEAGGAISKVTINQSLSGGSGAGSGSIISGTTLGATAIAGDVTGARIFAQGNPLPATKALALAIKSLSVGGSVTHSDILAGYDRNGSPINADVQIGDVTVDGDWGASDLVAGARPIDAYFGNSDELIPGGNSIVSRIASIVISGQVLGTPAAVNAADRFGFVAQEIAAFTIAGTTIKVTSGPGNDLAGLPLGATSDVHLREVP